MKAYLIKKFNGQKTMIVNNVNPSTVLESYKIARAAGYPFAIKKDIGIQIWGAFTVAEYCGIADCTKLLN